MRPRLLFPAAGILPAAFALLLAQATPCQTPYLVKDIRPGPKGSWRPDYSGMMVLGRHAYFAADDGVHGLELWRSDGTAKGTSLVKDIAPGSASSYPTLLGPVGNRMLFVTMKGRYTKAWATDGTSSGTREIPAGVRPFIPLGRIAYFTGPFGRAIWRTDGTASGTYVVRRNARQDGKGELAVLDGSVYYPGVPSGKLNGGLLRYTPGRPDTIVWKPDQSYTWPWIRHVTAVGGAIWFQVLDTWWYRREIWRSDGTAKGTVKVWTSPWPPDPTPKFTAVGSKVFFTDVVRGYGTELLVSDGTPQGTRMVKDIYKGSWGSDPWSLTEFRGRLLFMAWDWDGKQTHGMEPWISDGTARGTVLLKDLHPTKGYAHGFTSVGSRLAWFSGFVPGAIALWKTDGTERGTILVRSFGRFAGDGPTDLTVVNGRLLFFANDRKLGSGMELWAVFPGATAQPIGHACTAVGRRGTVLSATDPVFGATIRLEGRGFDPPTNVWVMASPHTAPRPLGPCMLHVDPATMGLVHASPLRASRWTASIPVPAAYSRSLLGRSFAVQALHAPTPSPFGGDLTNGLVMTFGR